jgi:hypothetical protein
MAAPLNLGNYTLTWGILYYLVALIHDRRIASSAVLSALQVAQYSQWYVQFLWIGI